MVAHIGQPEVLDMVRVVVSPAEHTGQAVGHKQAPVLVDKQAVLSVVAAAHIGQLPAHILVVSRVAHIGQPEEHMGVEAHIGLQLDPAGHTGPLGLKIEKVECMMVAYLAVLRKEVEVATVASWVQKQELLSCEKTNMNVHHAKQ